MISKVLQILSLQPQISKVFLDNFIRFFLTVWENKLGNKIPNLIKFTTIKY